MSSAIAGHLRALARSHGRVCAILCALLPLALVHPVHAQAPAADSQRTVRLLQLAPGETHWFFGRLDRPQEIVEKADSVQDWIVEFTAPPLLSPAARGAETPAAQLARFRADLRGVEIQARGRHPGLQALAATSVRREYSEIFNGVAVRAAGAVAEGIRRLPYVRAVHVDGTVRATLGNTVPLIRADRVWTDLGFKGEGEVIAIVDTGIDYNHPALGGGFGPGFRVVGGWDFVNNDPDPMDDEGHGTHVAGIAAGNAAPVVGVAPAARLLAFKVLSASGSGTMSNAIAGIERAVDPDGNPATHDGADVINLSLGAEGTPDDALSRAVDNASAAGVVVVAAAGNAGRYKAIDSPGAARSAIAVAGSDRYDALYPFSSRGPTNGAFTLKPDVTAPGVDVVSAARGGGTASMTGTSMATPHVAGVAALVRQAHPGWSPARVKAAIMEGSKDLGGEFFRQGTGRVDALRAVRPGAVVLPASISLGAVAPGTRLTRRDTLAIFNPDSVSRTYTITPGRVPGGITVALPAPVTVPPGDSARVTIDWTLDGDALPAVPYPYGSDGRLLVISGGDTAQVAFLAVAARMLSVAYDAEPYITVVHDRRGNVVTSTYAGPVQDVLLPPDAQRADVLATWWGGAAVVREDLSLAGSRAVTRINYGDASLTRTLQGRDGQGNVVKLDAAISSSRIAFGDAMAPVGIYAVGFAGTVLQLSPFSPAYQWSWLSVLNQPGKFYRFGGVQNGLQSSGTSENTAAQLSHKVLRISPPEPGLRYNAIPMVMQLYQSDRDVALGWGPVGFPITPPYTIDMYRVASTTAGHFPWDQVYMDTSSSSAWMSTPVLRLSANGDTLHGFSLGYTPVHYWASTADTIQSLFAPPRWNGRLTIWAQYFLGITPTNGDAGSIFPSATGDDPRAATPHYRLLRNGVLLEEHDIYRSLMNQYFDTRPTVGPLTLEVTSPPYRLGEYEGHATATLDFDPRLPDYDPPRLQRMQFVAGGRFVDAVYPGSDVQLRLAASDSGVIRSVAAAVRPRGTEAWTNVLLTADTDGWHATLPVDGTKPVDLRLDLSDDAGNRLRYQLEPALGTASTPPALVTLGTASFAPGDTVVTQAIALRNDIALSHFGYTISYADPLRLLALSEAAAVGRAAGLRSTAQWNAPATVTGALEDPAGRGIPAGSGPVLEHRFRVLRDTGAVRRLLAADTTLFYVERPGDPDRGTRRIAYRVAPAATALDARGAVPLDVSSPAPGRLELGLLSGDVNADGRVNDTDVTTLAEGVLVPRLASAAAFFGDLYPDGRLDVYDVVRAARLASGRPAVDTSAVRTGSQGAGAARGGPPARFSLTAAAEHYRLGIHPTVPIAGLQLRLRYDSSAVALGQIDEAVPGFRVVSGVTSPGTLDVLLYSPTATALPTGDVPLLALQAVPRRPGAFGSALTVAAIQLVGPDGRAIAGADPHLDGLDAPLPAVTALGEPFPNPFSSARPIHVPIDVAGSDAPRVRAVVYGIRGERIRTLLDDVVPAGHHVVDWDGKNDRGDLVSSGIYILLVEGPGLSMRRRLVFVR